MSTYFLNEVDSWLQIETKVDECPFNALSLVLFLFKDKHVVVEKLLQLLICQVNAKLFKGVQLKIWQKTNH